MCNETSSLADPARITCNALVYASNCARVTRVLDTRWAACRGTKQVQGEHSEAARAPLASGSETKERTWGMTAPAGLLQDQRQFLELVYDDGLTQAEIATRLGIPLGTVKTWVCRGLEQLRDM
jgi:RNA polymerase sigma-70 factor (ECF subfamily)